MRVILLLIVAASLSWAGTLKLYLKSGEYHVVREYQVLGDRVHYYSTERGDWEDIPTELVDFPKTEGEQKRSQDFLKRESQQLAEEEQAERADRKEIERIPMNTGAYYPVGPDVKALTVSDYKVVTDKKRQTLRYLSPIPIIPGHASVQIQGTRASFIVQEDRPAFFMRLEKMERFGIIKLTPKKTVRIVENISIVPVANQNVEEQNQVEAFQQEIAPGLFKVWPETALTPGEYALVEYTEGEVSLIVWDFAYAPGAAPPATVSKK